MTRCMSKSTACFDETYWDHNAAQPVLLIDEATEAITEAVYRLRAGSILDDRDLTAARVVLNDLFGGLKQLTDLFTGAEAIRDWPAASEIHTQIVSVSASSWMGQRSDHIRSQAPGSRHVHPVL